MRKLTDYNECCAYRKRLAKEKKNGKAHLTRSKTKNVTDCCLINNGDGDVYSAQSSELESRQKIITHYSLKKKSKNIKKSDEDKFNFNQVISRIQPTVDERQKYTNIQHILCVLNSEEAIKFVKLADIREKCNEKLQKDNEAEDAKINKKGSENVKSKKVKHRENNIEPEARKGHIKSKHTGKSGKQVQQDNPNAEKNNIINKIYAAAKDRAECSSICSIDSEVDLADFALTKKDIDKIEKNVKHRNSQQDCTKKSLKEDSVAKSSTSNDNQSQSSVKTS